MTCQLCLSSRVSRGMASAREAEQRPVFYGDTRVLSDRRKGSCLYWVRHTPPWPAHPFFCLRALVVGALPTSLLRAPPFLFPELLAVVSQVVPDVAPGFNVPAFYEDFVRERREMVNQRLARRQPPGPQPPTSPPQQQQQRGGGAVPIG